MPTLRLFQKNPRVQGTLVRDEIAAICTSHQLEKLALSQHIRADIGLDCGCNDRPPQKRYLP